MILFDNVLCAVHLALKLWFKDSNGSLKFQSYKNLWNPPFETLNPSLKNYCADFLSDLGFKFSNPVLNFKLWFKELLCIWLAETPIWKLKPPFEDLLCTFSFKPGFEVFKLEFEVQT